MWSRDDRFAALDVVINLHHLGPQIEAYCGDGSSHGLRIRYSHESRRLETGGGIQQALPLLGEEPFLGLNGDIFTAFALTDLSDIPQWADVHLLLTPTPAFREAGDFEYERGRIVSRGAAFVYCGISIVRPRLFSSRTLEPFSLRDLFFQATQAGAASAQVWRGAWTDIGTPEQLDAVNDDSD